MTRPSPPAPDLVERRFRRRAWALLLGLLVIGWLGYELGHPLHPTQSRWSRLVSRAVRLPAHWVQGRLATTARQVHITLDSAAWRTLTVARAVALQRGLLPTEAKIWVPATVQAGEEQAQPAKLRLKGDYPDHWRGSKWSLRVQLPPAARPAWGMRTFSVQDPATREYLAEWLLHRLLRAEGLPAIRYEFGQVTLNGQKKGVFAIEESFGPELLAANGLAGGVLLKLDETKLIDPTARAPHELQWPQDSLVAHAPIEVFDEKRVLADSVLAPRARRARALLAGVRAGTLALPQAFDAWGAGRLYAICDLLGAHHAVRWKNSRFAYNPTTGRLHLLAYDGNASGRIGQPYPERWRTRHLYPNDEMLWKSRFFNDPVFLRGYRAEAERLCRPGRLEAFVARVQPELTANLHLLYRDRPTYDYDWLRESMDLNRAVLREWLAAGR